MFVHKLRTITIFCGILLILSSCTITATAPDVSALATSAVGTVLAQMPPTLDANQISTSAAATVFAQLTLSAPPATSPVPDTATPTPTNTLAPVAPTSTVAPVVNATSSDKTLVATMATNCREGPTPDYAIVGYLKVGQSATILGRDSTSTWWYIQNPTNTAIGCWIWGGTTKASGTTAELPVFTPPPSPPSPTPGTGNFTLDLSTIRTCSGDKTAIITVSNGAGSAFESANVKSTDIKTSSGLANYSSDTPFSKSANGCTGSESTLAGNDTMYIPVSLGSSAAKDDIKVNITLCTKNGLKGICITDTIKFSMP